MPPQKLVPVMESLETFCREEDGVNSSVKKLSKDIPSKKSVNDDSYSNWEGLKFDQSYHRRESDASMLTEDTDSFIVGDRVWVGGNKPGVIAFIGETQFGPGDWAGVVLDEAIGKNDGSVAGIRYFQCPPNRGIFSRLSRLTRYPVDPSQISLKSLKTPGTPDRKFTAGSSPTSSISSRVQLPYSYNSIPSSSGSDIKVGDRVIVQSSHGSKAGVLRYYGNTEFGAGLWCGVELDDPLGKNDGSVAGVRYFDCAPKFGLFVPAEKVSRSPISNKKASCVVHPDGLTRQGTLDSIRTTSSTINTSISSIKSNSRKPTPRSSVTPSRTSTIQAPKSPLQEQLKEKEAYIKQLLKEKELERAQIIRAATQAEEVEKKLAAMKSDYDKTCSEFELQKTNYQQTIERLEKEKSRLEYQLEEEKKKIEDLQFNYEEESITKSEIQALNEEYVEKLKNFEKVVNSAHASLDYDGQSSGIFENDVASSTASVVNTSDVTKDLTEELSNSRLLILTLHEKQRELQNEVAALKETIEKMKVVDKNKDEVINMLKNEANAYQQLHIGNEGETDALKNDIVALKEKLVSAEKESDISKKEVLSLKEKLHDLEAVLKQKDEEIRKNNELIIAKERELRNEIESASNNLQFELDEYKMKTEEMTKKITQLTDDITMGENKRKNFVEISIHCLTQLSNDLKIECEVITKVILGNESATNAISALRSKDSSLSSLIENCPEELKDGFLELSQQMEQITHNNSMLLEKIETLTEVISRKDSQIDEITEEKENLRKEYLESIESKISELKNLESKYAELNKVKNDIERQLKISEENIKKMEAMCANKDHLSNEMENVRKHLEEKSVACEKLLQDAEALKEELKTKEEQNRRTRETLENEKENLKREIESINEKLKNEIDEKNTLRKDYNELQKVNEVTNTMNQAKNANEFDTLKNKIEQLISENQDKDEKLREMANRCKEYEEEETNLKKEISHMEENMKNISEKIKEFKLLTNDKSEPAIAQNDIETHLDEMYAYLKDLQTRYDSFQTSYKILESSKNELEEQLNSAKNESTRTKDKLDAISVEKSDLEKQMKECSSENKSLNEKLLQCEREILEISQKHAEIKSECDKKVKEFEEIQRKKDSLENVNQALINDTENLKSELHNLKENMQNKEQQVNTEKTQMEQNLRNLETINDNFKEKEKQYAEMNDEITLLREKVVSLNDELSNNEKKYLVEIAESKKSIQDLLLEKENLTAECKAVKSQLEKLKAEITNLQDNLDNANRNMNGLIADGSKLTNGSLKVELMEERNARNKLETELKNALSNDNALNNNVISTQDEKYSKLIEAKELAEGQVNFLNSVIVDMQRKNENLLERIQYLENKDPSEALTYRKPKSVAPRLFCDICDMFDLHETEDCPRQSNSSPPPVNRDTPKIKPLPRPYCENCEMFGHDTNDCNVEENY